MTFDKPKLDNARKMRGVNLIDSGDEEFKETMKYARKKLEIPMEACMLCKLKTMKRPIKLRENRQRIQRIQQNPEDRKHTCILAWKKLCLVRSRTGEVSRDRQAQIKASMHRRHS